MPAGPLLAVCYQTKTAPVVYRDSRFGIDVTHDVVYAKGLSHTDWGSSQSTVVELTLDVYEPTAAASSPRPVIILIHGGGFQSGTSRNGAFVSAGRFFSERSWVAFSINYRVAGQHGTVPDDWVSSNAAYVASRDIKAAVRWVRANAEVYNIDTDRITAQGGSAGGIAALMLGATNEGDYRDELTLDEDWTLATTNPTQSSRVATVVDHWGSLSAISAQTWYDGQPRIDSSDAPTVIFHGTADSVVPYAAGLAVQSAFEEAGILVELHPLPGIQHSNWQATVDGRPQNEVALDFIVAQQGLDLR